MTSSNDLSVSCATLVLVVKNSPTSGHSFRANDVSLLIFREEIASELIGLKTTPVTYRAFESGNLFGISWNGDYRMLRLRVKVESCDSSISSCRSWRCFLLRSSIPQTLTESITRLRPMQDTDRSSRNLDKSRDTLLECQQDDLLWLKVTSYDSASTVGIRFRPANLPGCTNPGANWMWIRTWRAAGTETHWNPSKPVSLN